MSADDKFVPLMSTNDFSKRFDWDKGKFDALRIGSTRTLSQPRTLRNLLRMKRLYPRSKGPNFYCSKCASRVLVTIGSPRRCASNGRQRLPLGCLGQFVRLLHTYAYVSIYAVSCLVLCITHPDLGLGGMLFARSWF